LPFRKNLEEALALGVNLTRTFRNAIVVLSPLFASLVPLLVGLGTRDKDDETAEGNPGNDQRHPDPLLLDPLIVGFGKKDDEAAEDKPGNDQGHQPVPRTNSPVGASQLGNDAIEAPRSGNQFVKDKRSSAFPNGGVLGLLVSCMLLLLVGFGTR